MTTAQFVTDPFPALELRGTGPRPAEVALVGARARVTASSLTGRGKTWRAVVPLQVARWGGPVLPLPSGDYELVGAVASVPLTQLGTLRAALDDTLLRIDPPIDPAYDSGEAQDALERRYATRPGGLENAVFYESFYGRSASCNPLAIDRRLAEVRPDIIRYWSVVDLSVQVPEGAVPVVEGSPEWWRARGAARLIVVNDWLRRRFERRPGQRVLQTWHGTPVKRLALHRSFPFGGGLDVRRTLAVLRESRRWNILLAQNPYGARILRKAYGFLTRPTWVEGYPRNDVLVTGDGAATRRALGIGADEKVLLYAPTWRDDRAEMVDFVDPVQLAADTGSVVLVRGHSRTLLPGRDAVGPRVIDVTAFPDMSQLLLIADALITDYSSVMFDYSVTGKPMYFLVPDLEHYRGELRGFYFDLGERAPGPLVRTRAELVEALAADPGAYAEKYAHWRSMFNARDDGHAAERVVARIIDQRLV
ncbi:MAG: CDP-glycerol glycerophosphotransferase family protein [Microbacterium sp.]|uniref:CDP-glycerol glycerophosphotransferase family protein n=1 Tax=Microbacterium sp. TaxID=51671 RepID=UPI003A8B31AE